jgi:hypothetical protein
MPLLILVTGFLILVPFVRVLFLGTLDAGRRVTLHLPFCDRHRNHWRWRTWPLRGLVLLSLSMIAGGVAVATMPVLQDLRNAVDVFGVGITGLAIIGGLLGLLVWGLLLIVVPFTGIRISDVTGSALTVTGVDEAFCEAVDERRRDPLTGGSHSESREPGDRPRAKKKQKVCSCCGESYSPRRPRCPHCGEANDSL